MPRKYGYNVTFDGQKCLSVTTGEQADGTYEFLIHALGGPGCDRHIHGYATPNSDGVIISGGARIKEWPDRYLSSGIAIRDSSQEIARIVISRTTKGSVCQFKQTQGDQWLMTGKSTMGGKITRPEVALPTPTDSNGAEYRISMFDSRMGIPPNTSQCVAIPFSTDVPFGIAFESVQRSAG